MQKKCPECGDKIVGRIDKKFCSDACRNSYKSFLGFYLENPETSKDM